MEIYVDETLFTLHINPYYLRLNFPHLLHEDDDASAQYDLASGFLTVTLTKAVPGQHFEDLDLLAKLLAPRKTEQGPLIEVLDSDPNITTDEDELVARASGLSLDHEEILEAAENDWQLKQDVPEPLSSLKTVAEEHYGFLDLYSGYFRHVEHASNEVNELGTEAETCPPQERRRKRLLHEEEKWDGEHYMADFADDEYIQELIHWEHPHTGPLDVFEYTEDEKATMLRLPRKEYLTTPSQTHNLHLTLLTLLFAYAYESRTTQRDPTSESGWTIGSLVPAFSALDPPPYSDTTGNSNSLTFAPSELAVTLAASYRRSLAFPLYRSFALAEKCREDIAGFLAGGKRMVLRCLLELKHILDHHEVYYVYSKIWVDDFCLWIQTYTQDDVLGGLSHAIRTLRIEKSLIGWDLEELERLTQGEDERSPDSDDESESEVERMLPAQL